MVAEKKKFLFVLNPIAGGNTNEFLREEIRLFENKNNAKCYTILTTGKKDRETVKAAIDKYQPHVAVAAGGDGTVNLLAQFIINTEIVLGIIPLGSGNGFAKELGIPLTVDAAFAQLLHPRVKQIDTLTANDHFFTHLCDLGFNAKVVELFHKEKKHGLFQYLKHTFREFFHYKTIRVKIRTDQEEIRSRAFMVTAANFTRFGSDLVINPEGKYDDGIFEVILIKRFPKSEVLKILFRLLISSIHLSPYCKYIRCTEAYIETQKPTILQVDGEYRGKVNSVEIKIFPNSLRVIA